MEIKEISNSDCWLKNKCNKKDCDKFCLRLFKLNYLYESALIPLNQRKNISLYLMDTKDKNAFNKLKEITSKENIINFINQGNNIYIHSINCGNAKTSWAIRIIQSYFDMIWPKTDLKCRALFIHVPTYLLELKNSLNGRNEYIEHIKQNIYDCDIVIWDEIGAKNSTPFEMENLLSIIDTRLNKGKSNIYTSNLDGNELQEKIGDRLYSRIINLSEDIEFLSPDQRNTFRNLGEVKNDTTTIFK